MIITINKPLLKVIIASKTFETHYVSKKVRTSFFIKNILIIIK